MDESLYIRKWQIVVQLKDGTVLNISDSDADKIGNGFGSLRCTFRINRPGYQAWYYGDVVVYNLNAETEDKIITEGDRVIINAGYEHGAYGKIFDGNVFQVFRDKEDVVNYRLTLHCLDGFYVLYNNIVSFTLNAGADQRDAITNVAAQARVQIPLGEISANIKQEQLPRGKVFFGEPKKYFRQIAQDNNAQFYVTDGEVNITRLADETDIPPGEALVLTPENGLIDTPQQIENGVRFKCLLDPRIKICKPTMLVKLDRVLISPMAMQIGQYPTVFDLRGLYRVVGLVHTGDTRGNEWYTEVTGVNSNGAIPALLRDPSMTAN